MNTNYYLKTNRLLLRNLSKNDVLEIYDYRNNINCYKYQKWDDTSIDYIKKFVSEYSNSQFLSFEKE